jgi:hypothetical protein
MIHAPSALQHRRNVHVRASNSPYGMQYLPNILSEIPYDAESDLAYLYKHSLHCTVCKDLARRSPVYEKAPV